MFFREDMNFSIIDGCDDEAPDRTCVFPFGTKKRQTGKNRHLPDPSDGRPPPGLFFRILLPCRRPPNAQAFFYRPEHLPQKTRKTLYEHGDMPDSLHPVANSHVLPLAFANKKAKWHHKGTKNRIARHTRIARQSIIRIFRS